jgi:hypothetical protein
MEHRTHRTALAAAVLASGALVTGLTGLSSAGATGPDLTHYSVRSSDTFSESLAAGESPCGEPMEVTFDRSTTTFLASTAAGLSDVEVLALVADDPNGLVRQTTVTSTGPITLTTAQHTYTGRSTQRVGGQFLPNGMWVISGEFSVTATSELGTRLVIKGHGHDVDDFDGTTKMFNGAQSVNGCLP